MQMVVQSNRGIVEIILEVEKILFKNKNHHNEKSSELNFMLILCNNCKIKDKSAGKQLTVLYE